MRHPLAVAGTVQDDAAEEPALAAQPGHTRARRADEAQRRSARDAPTAVEAEVLRAIDALELAGRSLLVAVSGGVDSITLADCLHRASAKLGLALTIAHIDHGLRGSESDGDASFVARFAADRALPFVRRHADPASRRADAAGRGRPTLQEAARDARYAALEDMRNASGCDWIVTAHSADDQAETVLMRVLRGAGPDSLAGIEKRDAARRIARPMLAATRAEVEAHARARGLRWREDSSNGSDRYTRNRLRHHWIPALADEFNPQLLRSLANLAETVSREREWLRELTLAEVPRHFERRAGGLRIHSHDWDELAPALASRLVRWALVEMGIGREITRQHVERVLAFLGARGAERAAPGRVLQLPCGIRLRALRGEFELQGPAVPDPAPESASSRPC